MAKYADKVVLIDKTVMAEGTVREVYESKEFKDVFGNSRYEITAKSITTPIYDVDVTKGHVHKRDIVEKQTPFEASYKGRKGKTDGWLFFRII